MQAKKHAAKQTIVPVILVTPGTRNNSTGKNGALERRSMCTSAQSSTTPIASIAILVVDHQAKRWPAKLSQSSQHTAVAAKRNSPRTSVSGATPGCGGLGGRRRIRHVASSASGRFAKNSQRQLVWLTTYPPTTGPARLASVKLAAK